MTQQLHDSKPLPWEGPETSNTDPGVLPRRKLNAELLDHYMHDSEAIQHLISLDIGDDSLAVLSLIPLVEVARPNGNINQKDRDTIVAAAESCSPATTPLPAIISNTG